MHRRARARPFDPLVSSRSTAERRIRRFLSSILLVRTRNLEQLMRAPARGHAPTKARDMHGRLRNAYRTFDVRVEIDQTERASFNGSDRRYEVRWSVARPRYPDRITETLGLFKEQLAFISSTKQCNTGKGGRIFGSTA